MTKEEKAEIQKEAKKAAKIMKDLGKKLHQTKDHDHGNAFQEIANIIDTAAEKLPSA